MLVIGSRALAYHIQSDRKTNDWDYICTFEEFQKWTAKHKQMIVHCVPLSGDKFHVRDKGGMNYEFDIAWPGTSSEMLLKMYHEAQQTIMGNVYITPFDQLMLKESHKYRKNSPHFFKTMGDIHVLRKYLGLDHIRSREDYLEVLNDEERAFLELREKETYDYAHPKLDVTKKDFFTDSVPYIYDHDSLHLAVALMGTGDINYKYTIPAYTYYMKDGSEVMTSKKKFFSVEEKVRLYGVYEESCVLALERSQIPHGLGKEGGPTPRWSFLKALEKVCTSITSGYFREYAWENYNKVVDLYEQMGEDDYIKRFQRNQFLLKPFKE